MSFAIRSRRARTLALATLSVIPTLAHAASTSWTFNGNGNWTLLSNWNGGVPASNTDAFVSHADAINRTITYDYAGVSINYNSLTVQNTGTGSDLFSQSNNTFNANVENIGSIAGSKGYWSLSGGSHFLNGAGIYFGQGTSSFGVGTMSGALLSIPGAEVYVGYYGSATFTQNGGTISATFLTTGWRPGGTGTYNFNAGTANITGGLYSGFEGSGTINLSGGTMNAASEFIASSGTGWLNQTAGNNTVSPGGELLIGNSAAGTYLLSGTGSLIVNGSEVVGVGASGNFNQSGGTQTIGTSLSAGTLDIAQSGGSTGSYSLSGGTTSLLTVYGEEIIGDGGTATFNQSAGVNAILSSSVGTLLIGKSSGGAGSYLLSGSGSLTVNGYEIVGGSGIGIFNQSGGVQGAINIDVGSFSGGTGNYSLSAGSLTVLAAETVGDAGMATFNQSGGVHTIGLAALANGMLVVGNSAGGTGTFLLSGSGSITVNGTEVVGDAGTATFKQTGGVHSVASGTLSGGTLFIGNSSGGAGTYLLSGTGLLAVDQAVVVGVSGNGTFVQSGGMLSASGLSIGSQPGGAGTYNLSDGTILVTALSVGKPGNGTVNINGGTLNAQSEDVGASGGSGLINQTAGVNTVGEMGVGHGGEGSGTYLLGGTGFLTVTEVEGVRGTFNQSGGVHTVGSPAQRTTLAIGDFVGAGIYLLSGGSLSVNGSEIVGDTGIGTFNQTGGVQNLASGSLSSGGLLYIGNSPGSAGTYLLSGSGSLTAGSEFVGFGGTANFIQSGGTNNVGSLVLPQSGVGTYSLSGGTLDVSTFTVLDGGTFIYSGGTLLGVVNLTGGLLSIQVGNSAQLDVAVNVSPGSTATIDGTLVASSTADFKGAGTLATDATGTVRSSGRIDVFAFNNAGTLGADMGALVVASPNFFNFRTVTNYLGASLFLSSPNFVNSGNILVNGGGAVSIDSSVVNSAGHSIILLGGALGAPSVTNSSGALVSGFGQITGNLTNNGSISFIGPTEVVGTFQNNAGGVLAVRNAPTLITGLAMNAGTITASNGTIIFDVGPSPGAPIGTGGIDGAGTLLVNPGGHLIASYVRQSALTVGGVTGSAGIGTIRARSDGGTVSVVDSFSISGSPGSWAGILDLDDNDLIAKTAPLSTMANYIAAGYAGGGWTGLGVISAHAAAIAADAANHHKTALGYATASSLGVTLFDAQSVGGSNVLVKYTYSGDANLDGVVNALDFNALATNFGQHAGTSLWIQGDFNYDGFTNTQDFTLLATNFDQAMASPSLGTTVPEPASLLTLAAVLSSTRRRRHH